MALLNRVRRVLWSDQRPPRRPRLSEGLLALAVPVALWAAIATVGPVLAQEDETKEDQAKSETLDDAIQQEDDDLIRPEFERKTDRSLIDEDVTLAIRCKTNADVQFDNPELDQAIIESVSRHLQSHGIRVRQQPDDASEADIRNDIPGATHVLFIEVNDFQLYEPDSTDLYRGRTEAVVHVTEIQTDGTDKIIYLTELSSAYPLAVPVPVSQKKFSEFRREYIEWLGEEIGRQFYPYARYNGDPFVTQDGEMIDVLTGKRIPAGESQDEMLLSVEPEIAETWSNLAEQRDEDELHDALRELHEELKSLRKDVEELRGNKPEEPADPREATNHGNVRYFHLDKPEPTAPADSTLSGDSLPAEVTGKDGRKYRAVTETIESKDGKTIHFRRLVPVDAAGATGGLSTRADGPSADAAGGKPPVTADQSQPHLVRPRVQHFFKLHIDGKDVPVAVEETRDTPDGVAKLHLRRLEQSDDAAPTEASADVRKLVEKYRLAVKSRDEAARLAAAEAQPSENLAHSQKRLVEAQRELERVQAELERKILAGPPVGRLKAPGDDEPKEASAGVKQLVEEYRQAMKSRDEAARLAASEAAKGVAPSQKRLVEAQRELARLREELERRKIIVGAHVDDAASEDDGRPDEDSLRVVKYQVGDLIASGSHVTTPVTGMLDTLVNLITRSVRPSSWGQSGCSIQKDEKELSLIVVQTEEAHAEIADLLKSLQMLQRTGTPSGDQDKIGGQTKPSAEYLRDDIQYFPSPPEITSGKPAASPTDDATKALEKPVSLHFDKTPLEHVLATLRNIASVNVVIDKPGLDEEGVTLQTPVSINVDDMPIRDVLPTILTPLNLTATTYDGVVAITSRQRAKGPLEVQAYPVADLVVPVPHMLDVEADRLKGKVHSKPEMKQKMEDRLDTLIELITGTIDPGSWEQVGGRGVIRKNDATLSLVVRQTRDVHDEIADLLQRLRKLERGEHEPDKINRKHFTPKAAAADAAEETTSVKVRVEQAGTYYVDGYAASATGLASAIKEAAADGDRTELVIQADKAAPFSAVARVIEAAKEIGIDKIRFATEPGASAIGVPTRKHDTPAEAVPSDEKPDDEAKRDDQATSAFDKLVSEYNELIKQRDYAGALVVATKATDSDPEKRDVGATMVLKAQAPLEDRVAKTEAMKRQIHVITEQMQALQDERKARVKTLQQQLEELQRQLQQRSGEKLEQRPPREDESSDDTDETSSVPNVKGTHYRLAREMLQKSGFRNLQFAKGSLTNDPLLRFHVESQQPSPNSTAEPTIPVVLKLYYSKSDEPPDAQKERPAEKADPFDEVGIEHERHVRELQQQVENLQRQLEKQKLQARERQDRRVLQDDELYGLLNKFNELITDERFSEAAEVVNEAKRIAPSHRLTDDMQKALKASEEGKAAFGGETPVEANELDSGKKEEQPAGASLKNPFRAAGKLFHLATQNLQLHDEPRPVEGKVMQIVSAANGGEQYVVSLGSNHHLQQGDMAVVYRDNSFVARLELTSVEDMLSLGRVVQSARDKEIREGDRVVSAR